MYLAMNRFTVPLENADAFEKLWLARESHLQNMAGFVSFHMLKSPQQDGCFLYASHTLSLCVAYSVGNRRAFPRMDHERGVPRIACPRR